MINTWNPAEISDKLNQLEGQIKANDVIANPTGEATETLTKIEIDGDIYSFTAETTAADVSYDNTSSGLTADDVQDAIDELNTTTGAIPVIEMVELTGTTNSSGKITISADNVPLDTMINVLIKSPTGYTADVYRGSSSYGIIVRNQGTVTPLDTDSVTYQVIKFK